MSSNGRQLEGIQYLRAIAALMVVLFHLAGYIGPPLKLLTQRFPAGVDIFFVISGFIMLITSQRATPGSFLRRRIVRIVPLYWLLTLAIFVAAVPTLHRHSVGELVKSLLFVPYPDIRGSADLLPLIGPGWSLNLEMYFYVLFAVTLAAPLRRWAVPILGLLFTTLILLHDATSFTVARFYMQPRIIEFWAGMVIGWLYLRGRLNSRPALAVAAVLLGFAALVAFEVPYQVPAILITSGVICLEVARRVPQWRALGYLGDASYSLYLSHSAVIEVVYLLWRRLHLADGLLFLPVALCAAVGGGLLCYRYVERPLLNLWDRRPSRKSAAPESSAEDPAAAALVAQSRSNCLKPL